MNKDFLGMFDLPDYISRNRERKEHLIRAVLQALITISIISGISIWVSAADITSTLIFGGSAILCIAGLLQLKKGREKIIASLLIIIMWIFLTAMSYFWGEVNASLSLGYLILMIIAMTVIDRWAGWFVAISGLITSIVIPIIVDIYGPSSLRLSESSSHLFYTQIAMMILGAILFDVTIQGVNQFLRISRKYEQRYRALFESSNDATFIIALDHTVIETNKTGELLLDYSQEEFRKMKAENLVASPKDLNKYIKLILCEEIAPSGEGQLITKKGDLVDVQISTSLVCDEKNNPLYLQCVARDIREKKITEHKLMEYTQRYQAMFDSTVDAVFIIGLDVELLDANEQAAKMLGYETFEEFREHAYSDFILPEDKPHFQHVIDDLLDQRKVPKFDCTMVCQDGRKIIVEVSAGIVYNSAGKPLYVQTISRDVTEKRMREERLENSLVEMEQLAMTDPLTKLLNRRAILEQAQIHIDQAKMHQGAFSVMLIDVDLLKHINDGYGHHAGDITLIYISAQLEKGMRASDRVGRWGGDEFLIIMPRTGLKEAEIVARRLNDLIGQKDLKEESRAFRVATSIGVAGTESGGEGVYDLSVILELADKAMYLAKEAGRHGVAVFQQEEEVER